MTRARERLWNFDVLNWARVNHAKRYAGIRTMADLVSLEGPVELIDGALRLQIPLAAGGDKLALVAKGIGKIEGDFLTITILPWLAQQLCIADGSLVIVDNKDGKFNITRSAANDADGPA